MWQSGICYHKIEHMLHLILIWNQGNKLHTVNTSWTLVGSSNQTFDSKVHPKWHAPKIDLSPNLRGWQFNLIYWILIYRKILIWFEAENFKLYSMFRQAAIYRLSGIEFISTWYTDMMVFTCYHHIFYVSYSKFKLAYGTLCVLHANNNMFPVSHNSSKTLGTKVICSRSINKNLTVCLISSCMMRNQWMCHIL